jgi:hypothetical protein
MSTLTVRTAEKTSAAIPYMSQANMLGQGFNIYGPYSDQSLLLPLFNFAATPTQTFRFQGQDYEIPSIVQGIENSRTISNEGSYASREGFQSAIAIFANVDASYGAFSGQLEAAYSNEYTSAAEYSYAFKNTYVQMGQLQLNPDPKYLNPAFVAAVAKLPSTATPKNLGAFSDFFGQFGVYYTESVSLGASFEYYAAVNKASSEGTQTIWAMLQAQYDGAYLTGSVDTSVTSTQNWQNYSQNAYLTLITNGGDPQAAAVLQNLDPKNPSTATVAAYQTWLGTIGAHPAATNFKLAGIWNLCGDKRDAVHDAWALYGAQMHPRLSIETASGMLFNPPTVILGRQIKPATPPATTAGWQITILDRKNVLDDSGIKFNRYYTVDPDNWDSQYEQMYADMTRDIQASGFFDNDHLLIAVSWGLDQDCVPTSDFYGLLRACGGGKNLVYWENNFSPGSDSDVWAVYALVGIIHEGPDTGIEGWGGPVFQQGVNITVGAYFYRLSVDDPYTIGLNPYPSN